MPISIPPLLSGVNKQTDRQTDRQTDIPLCVSNRPLGGCVVDLEEEAVIWLCVTEPLPTPSLAAVNRNNVSLMVIPELPFASVSKEVQLQSLSYGN